MDTQAIQAAIDANDALPEVEEEDMETEEEATEAQPQATAAPEGEKIPRYVAVMVTPDQYRAIKAAAGNKALSSFVLQLTADVVGFKVEPAKSARRKYATKAEAKAANAARAKTKNEAMKEFLAQHAAEFEKLLAAKAQENGVA